jgi:Heparinase II/III-like protein.
MKFILVPVFNFILVFFSYVAHAQHPSIMLTKKNVPAVSKGIADYPLLKRSFIEIKKLSDEALSKPINVPVPKDGGGGFTHEQHKLNYQYILAAGTVYQITKEKKYADFVKNILLNYASQYESWPLHPKSKSSNPAGRIFWQNLNDCVWQVYAIQGYDMVYDYLLPSDRNTIEQHLFFPIVKFLSEDNYETFNRIHNHGTWDVAAVGMTGYVLNKKEWVEKALHGSNKDDKTGFLAQVNQLFSPDGYYTEGPYYQRYALLPFLVFAKAINEYQPQLKIYDYNNGVLKKAIHTALQLTYTNGAFFPVNDALKDKTFESEELVYGVDLAYADMAHAADLLDVAQHQNKVIISDAGLIVAKDAANNKAKPFNYKSVWLTDGNKGDEGGLGILRAGDNNDQQCILLKAAAQGMGHGHFDRLNFLYYDHGGEVFSDYGSARFLNIETKSGGDYLPENKSWAKQTVAHNTVVVDETSHYKGDVDVAQRSHPELIYFNADNNLQVVSAKESNAYKDVTLIRTVALANIKELEKPLVIDVFKIISDNEHQYDLPYWYQGHITNTPFTIQSNTKKLEPLGKANGYQYIWLNAAGSTENGNASITFLNNRRFYTTTFLADASTQIKFVTVGANDPNFNLRDEKGFIISAPKTKDHLFISVVESHGNTDPTAETTTGFKGKIQSVKLITDTRGTTSFQFTTDNKTYIVTINYNNKQSFINIK